jgi:cytochrome c-type biogenesis protein
MDQSIANTAPRARWNTVVQSLYFVLGFAVFIVGVFGAVGALADAVYGLKDIIRIAGGVLMILFGLFTLRIINIPILYSDTRRGLTATGKRVGAAQSFLTGLSFAAGWTPCIGPFLGAILTLSVDSAGALRVFLLAAYTFGLGLPFVLVALLADRMTPLLRFLRRNMRAVELISGILLIVVGVLLIAGLMTELSRAFAGVESALESDFAKSIGFTGVGAPSVLVALVAGFLSFASPCVLPLVPAYLGFISGWAVNSAERPQA